MTQIFDLQAQLQGTKILVVGDLMLDRYWFGDVSRVSAEAPVLICAFQRDENRLGGAGNVVCNLEALGVPTALIAITGEDEAHTVVKELLGKKKIDSHLLQDKMMVTTTKLRVVAQKQQQIVRLDFDGYPKQAAQQQLLEKFQSLVDHFDGVIFSDYKKGTLAYIQEMIVLTKKAGKAVFIDPRGYDYSIYRGADVITPNLVELSQIIGVWDSEEQLEERVHRLCVELDLDAVLLTRSQDGMSLFSQGRSYHVAAHAKEVYDVSGAGDTVIAVYSAARLAGLSRCDAMRVANRTAGLVVEKFGTAAVKYEELQRNAAFCPLDTAQEGLVI